MRCIVKFCPSNVYLPVSGGGVSTHRIPKKAEKARQWWNALEPYLEDLEASSSSDCIDDPVDGTDPQKLRVNKYNGNAARVCSLHFKEDDFHLYSGKLKLNKCAVPSIFQIDKENIQSNVSKLNMRTSIRPVIASKRLGTITNIDRNLQISASGGFGRHQLCGAAHIGSDPGTVGKRDRFLNKPMPRPFASPLIGTIAEPISKRKSYASGLSSETPQKLQLRVSAVPVSATEGPKKQHLRTINNVGFDQRISSASTVPGSATGGIGKQQPRALVNNDLDQQIHYASTVPLSSSGRPRIHSTYLISGTATGGIVKQQICASANVRLDQPIRFDSNAPVSAARGLGRQQPWDSIQIGSNPETVRKRDRTPINNPKSRPFDPSLIGATVELVSKRKSYASGLPSGRPEKQQLRASAVPVSASGGSKRLHLQTITYVGFDQQIRFASTVPVSATDGLGKQQLRDSVNIGLDEQIHSASLASASANEKPGKQQLRSSAKVGHDQPIRFDSTVPVSATGGFDRKQLRASFSAGIDSCAILESLGESQQIRKSPDDFTSRPFATSSIDSAAEKSEPVAKRMRYAGDIKDIARISAEQANHVLPKVLDQLSNAHARINKLKVQKHRVQKKLDQLKELVAELKDRNILSKKGEIILQDYTRNQGLQKEILEGHPGRAYSAELKRFAMTLHFYSAKAYRYVRQSFDNNLPNENTIVRWYRSIDGSPGITGEALATLEQKAKDNKPLLACLVMDEVAIRQQVQWNQYIKKFEGIVDFGDTFDFPSNTSDDLVPAKKALVFLVSAVDDTWKIPVAYYLINGLNATDKTILVEYVCIALENAGVKIIGFTFDGTTTNIATANNLGCNLKPGSDTFRTCFPHPSSGHPVYVVLGPCHMLKLVRNIFCSQGLLRTFNGEARWDYISRLNEFQNLTDCRLKNRLTDKHVFFANQKMKVVLAAQTLSQSVANALDILKCRNPDFADADGTIEFISLFNDIVDSMNSKNLAAEGFKKPLCEVNFDAINLAYEYAESYILNVALSTGEPILKTAYKTGFLGFLIDISSFRGIFEEYVLKQRATQSIATYRFSQDHVETFFAALRSKGGCNNNPNAAQFRAAYKRLLCNNNVSVPEKSNCSDLNESSLLMVDQAQLSYDSILSRLNQHRVDDEEEFKIMKDQLLKEVPYLDGVVDDDFLLDEGLSYRARNVQKQIVKSLKCKKCLAGLLEHNGFRYSCKGVESICKIIEMEWKILVAGKHNLDVSKYFNYLIHSEFRSPKSVKIYRVFEQLNTR